MATTNNLIAIPRPGSLFSKPIEIIQAPSRDEFAQDFGTILPESKYISTDKGRIAYYELSPPPNSSISIPDRVLLVHGVQTPAIGLLPLARRLQQSYPGTTFVLVDLYGHGLSDTPLTPYTPELFYELIDRLLDHLSWPKVHLIGFSFGGATAVGYTATRTDRIESLVLAAPAGLLHLKDFSAADQALITGSNDDYLAAEEMTYEFLEGGPLVVPADWRERTLRGEMVAEALKDWQSRHHKGHRASVTAMFFTGGALDSDEKFKVVGHSGVPSIAILGEEDTVCTREDLLEKGFQDVEVVPNAGHGLVRTHVDEVAKHILGFWDRLNASV